MWIHALSADARSQMISCKRGNVYSYRCLPSSQSWHPLLSLHPPPPHCFQTVVPLQPLCAAFSDASSDLLVKHTIGSTCHNQTWILSSSLLTVPPSRYHQDHSLHLQHRHHPRHHPQSVTVSDLWRVLQRLSLHRLPSCSSSRSGLPSRGRPCGR